MDRNELERRRQRLEDLKKARESRTRLEESALSKIIQDAKADEARTELDKFNLSINTSDEIENRIESKENFQILSNNSKSSSPELKITNVFSIDVPGVNSANFSKNVQTEEAFLDREWMTRDEIASNHLASEDEFDDPIRMEVEDGGSDHIEHLKINDEEGRFAQELTGEEKRKVIDSEEFLEFLEKSTKTLEKALNEPYDITKEYSTDFERVEESETFFQLQNLFFFDKYTKNKIVTDLGYSSKHPELVVAAYSADLGLTSDESDADGCVLVWNQYMKDRPEFVFQSMSSVSSVFFSKFHPNLIVGGTHLGQILLWDTRAKSRPVQYTPISLLTHTRAVHCLSLVGNPKTHHVVSLSMDGLLCAWSLESLKEPLERLELMRPNYSRIDEITPLSMTFSSDSVSDFLVGSEEGTIYHGHRFDREQEKAGISPLDTYNGHEGPVFGVKFCDIAEVPQVKDIFISCGADFTVCLWRSKMNLETRSSPEVIRPIHRIDSSTNSIFDVNWCPVNPSMFSTADAGGIINIFDLNKDVESPIASINEPNGRGFSRCQWHEDGRSVAAGTAAGDVQIYYSSKITKISDNETSKLVRVLGNLERTAPNRLVW